MRADVAQESSRRHQNAILEHPLSHLPISGICCLTLLLPQPAARLPCLGQDSIPNPGPL